MSSDKNPEVVGCDASIMKNVWEIRVRDYNQKLDVEQERLSKSALPVINQDWANRMTAKKTGYKRVEKKAKPTEDQTDADVWKSKQPLGPRVTPPRAVGVGGVGRTGVQGRGSSTATPSYKEKKGQGKTFSKLQLLLSIDQTQPSNLVWGKAWKYNKSLPSADGGFTASLDWGQPWMFVNHQPNSEADKPWSDEPRMYDPQDFHMWRKPDYKNTEPTYQDMSLPIEDWQRSWNLSDKVKRDSAEDKNSPKQGFFTTLIETQHRNVALSSSEWMDSWQSLKAPEQHAHANTQSDNLLRQSDVQDTYKELSPEWKESWMLVNHNGDNNFRSPLFENVNIPEWTKAWRIAQTGFRPSDSANVDDLHNHGQQKDSHALTTNYGASRHHYKNLTNLYTEFQGESEWNSSWQVLKNDSKPCEEIDKVLKAAKPEENAPSAEKNVAKNQRGVCSADKADPLYDQLKYEVIYQTKREMMKSKLLLLTQLQKTQPSSDWNESWKTLKHRMREERRRLRSDLLKPLLASDKQEAKKPNTSEWKSSWKHTCQQLNQQPDRWQEGWSTVPPVRRNMQRHPSEFSPEKFPKNGPAKEQIWKESWKFSRSQYRSEAGQSKEKVPKGTQQVSSYDIKRSCDDKRHPASTSDWQDAWMVSETQYHHDRPSLTQWREAWRCSIFHTQHMAEESKDKWLNEIAQIQPTKNLLSSENIKVKMSHTFDEKMFRQCYPEKDWNSSWSARPLLNNQSSFYGSGNGAQQQRDLMDGSRWGHWFRVANPMPQLEKPWLDTCSNPIHYLIMWEREKKNLKNTKSSASIVNANFHSWANSHCFMQNGQRKGKSKSREPIDPRVILQRKIRTKKQLYSEIEKQKQSDRKFVGCHLLGKTQPRPKKGRTSTKKPEPVIDKFFEEWFESWRFLVQPETLNKQKSFKPLSGWNESWKLLIPPY